MRNWTLLAFGLALLIGVTAWGEFFLSKDETGVASPVLLSGPAVVGAVRTDGTLVLTDGAVVRLQGIDLPAVVVRSEAMGVRLQAFVQQRLEATGGRVWLVVDGEDPEGVTSGVVTVRLRPENRGSTLNEAVLQRGLAVFRCRTAQVTRRAELFASAQAAQNRGVGWFGQGKARQLDAPGYLNGAVIGLYHQIESIDYHQQLDELREAGFQHVSLLFPGFIEKVDSVDIRRNLSRTVTDARLIETIGYAKHRGMSVLLLPIVLILDPGDEDWRGVLKPKDLGQWWQNYSSFLDHYLDIAESTGVDLFSVGSELGSLEDQTDVWNRVILNARGRYRGLLTYSANWDHGDVAEFFPSLDVVGMSAYFSLTEKRDPTVEELVVEWRRVAKGLRELVKRHGRPLILTELGYASQDGINQDPWNYVMNTDEIDLQEQSDCFEAFRRVAPEMEFLSGAYFYDYYDQGGVQDWSYSPRGKPAMAQWSRWARQK